MAPFKSKSQMRALFAKEAKGELKKGTAERWAKETPNIKALPEKAPVKKGFTSTTQLRAEYKKKYGKK